MLFYSKEVLKGSAEQWKSRVLSIVQKLDYAVILDGHHHPDQYGTYDWVAAGGAVNIFRDDFQSLKESHRLNPTWLFGVVSYDAKSQMEPHWSNSLRRIQQMPEIVFFEPAWVVTCLGENVILHVHIEKDRPSFSDEFVRLNLNNRIDLVQTITKEEYIQGAENLLAHIQRGDIYEVNYCMQWEGLGYLDPLNTWLALNDKMEAPFSGYFRAANAHLLSMSPERFIAKKGLEVISQPIKGTAKRGLSIEEDEQNARTLFESEKERGENVMIVDLVRNDLSRVAVKGSVSVPELFGIHSFNTVHQMISTVHCTVDTKDIFDVIEVSFPMGSMTGAPKHSAIKLIEEVEKYARGWYSGCLGYITPEGDADFNVVIRSLVYDSKLGLSTLGVGSALTFLAKPEEEYEECLLKAKAIRESLWT